MAQTGLDEIPRSYRKRSPLCPSQEGPLLGVGGGWAQKGMGANKRTESSYLWRNPNIRVKYKMGFELQSFISNAKHGLKIVRGNQPETFIHTYT